MLKIAILRPGYMRPACYGARDNQNYQRIPAIWRIKMAMNSKPSLDKKKEELPMKIQKSSVSWLQTTSQTNPIFPPDKKLEFGQFVAREAVLDEEYWTAAWLRAETHWEGKRDDRYADSYKRKFAEQEFNALKRQSKAKLGEKSACIVTVKKQLGNETHTVLKSIVGTLDVSIRHFLHGETFPGEKVKAHIFFSTKRRGQKNQYGYIANLCVAKSARRQGIARNMLHFSIQSAISDGAEKVYVHVHRKNIAAQELYQKMGFEVVESASPQLSGEKTFLLCFRQ